MFLFKVYEQRTKTTQRKTERHRYANISTTLDQYENTAVPLLHIRQLFYLIQDLNITKVCCLPLNFRTDSSGCV